VDLIDQIVIFSMETDGNFAPDRIGPTGRYAPGAGVGSAHGKTGSLRRSGSGHVRLFGKEGPTGEALAFPGGSHRDSWMRKGAHVGSSVRRSGRMADRRTKPQGHLCRDYRQCHGAVRLRCLRLPGRIIGAGFLSVIWPMISTNWDRDRGLNSETSFEALPERICISR
jgi:hypothetical protein